MTKAGDYQHFTGKKKKNGPKKRKRKERSKRVHTNKYLNK